MKLPTIPTNEVSLQTTEVLEKVLLDRVLKLRKLQKEMKEDAKIQRAEDVLIAAKIPYKIAKTKWVSEIGAIELELKTRNIKFSINWDDIYLEEV
jgi:hypothetical protein